jgi:hypothetical protein
MRNDGIDGSSPSCEVGLSLFVFICPSPDAHSGLSVRTTYMLFGVNLLATISKTPWKNHFHLIPAKCNRQSGENTQVANHICASTLPWLNWCHA